ncbi:kinase-like domain-containing protein [Suillus variegatus]|nr:kinase-like domain-containing protein [Suillus variegatus]
MCKHLPNLFGTRAFLGRYSIEKHCGKGAFGDVVSARFSPCPGSDKLVVIKIECNSIVGTKRIPNEQAAYEALKGIPGIPRCYEVVCFKNHGIIVLDRLGDNLRKYKESCGLSLPIITIYTLGKAIVKILQDIHGRGVVHRDIKPDNILLPLDGELQPHLVDFGLTKQYRDSTGAHKQESQELAEGTLPFMSLNVHSNSRYSWRDDIISLAYTLIYLSHGSLPWYGLSDGGCKQMKTNFRPSDLTPPSPVALELFLNYATNLNYADDPDYKHLQDILN